MLVKLLLGASINIESHEAFSTIDGHFYSINKLDNSKETILRKYFNAVMEVAQQLKFRNIEVWQVSNTETNTGNNLFFHDPTDGLVNNRSILQTNKNGPLILYTSNNVIHLVVIRNH